MPVVYTIGHSNRSMREFIELLAGVNASLVVDVRRWPTSRRLPHFTRENLREALQASGIEYTWMPELGGYRKFGVDVPLNLEEATLGCLKSRSFRAYFVYLRVNEVARERVEWIARKASEKVVVLMCRERIPWRCHRKLISDLLVLKGLKVVHIIERGRMIEHRVPECRRMQSI